MVWGCGVGAGAAAMRTAWVGMEGLGEVKARQRRRNAVCVLRQGRQH